MTATLTARARAPFEARSLAAYLSQNGLPGQRKPAAITALRRERAARKSPPPVVLPVKQRLHSRLLDQDRTEIGRRGGEIDIEGSYSCVELEIWDRDPDQRLRLVGAEGWRQYSKQVGARRARLAYLCGTDDNGSWAVRVPGTLRTVAEAVTWLEPAEVTAARSAGRRVLRQGDVYAVETTRAHDGAGITELPDGHRWNPGTRYLTHHPDDGRKHRPLKVSFPARFVPQRAYGMGRGAGRANAD
jgi:hypothetical protein